MIDTPGLTRCQRITLFAIGEFIKSNGHSPTYTDITKLIGCAAKSNVYRHVNSLIERGYLSKLPGRARSIEIVDRSIQSARVVVKVNSQGQYLHTVKFGNVNVSVETVSV